MATFRTTTGVSALDPKQGHLVLVGLPGAGKSSGGRAAADELGRIFIDLDEEIARRESSTVASIFAEYGEGYFRQKEHTVTAELREMGGMIVAPGGGWMAYEGNVALLRPPSRIVYLKVTPAIALARLGPAAQERPLLRHPNPLGELERLLALREPIYATADHVIDTDLLTVQEVTGQLIKLARR
jgi:shikimate kinase